MISWQLVPALRVGLALAAGIACARLSALNAHLEITICTTAAITLLMLLWPLPLETRAKFRGLGILLATVLVGFILGTTTLPKAPDTRAADAKAFVFQLQRQPTKSTNWYSVDGIATAFRADSGWTESNSRVRLLLPPARVTKEMRIGATYLVHSKLSKVSGAKNPHAFDYSSYLRTQGIGLQAFAPPIQIDKGPETGMVLLKGGQSTSRLTSARNWISRRVDLALPTPNEAAVAKALLLGDKSGLSEDTRKNYTRTGAVHVLAVSGLHTGIIASIILGLLGLLSWRKELAWLKLFVFWASLFGYAAITGFSPSVQRSAVMFGILFAGKVLRKDANAFNSLGLSAIVLLAIDPQLLFELGFQLSYCAVAGILAFYPSLRKLFAAENYLINAIGELNAVSIAATIGTLPLTTFYFHQFPVYFLLSGILAVPLVGLALPALLGGIGIDVVFTIFGSSAYWAYVPAYLLIWLCNACLEAIAAFPSALVSRLWPSMASTGTAITAIVMLGAAVLRRRKRLYWMALVLGICWSATIAYSTYCKLKTDQVIVYSLGGELIIDAFKNGRVTSTAKTSKETFSSRTLETITTHRAAMNATVDTSSELFIAPPLSPKPNISFGIANGKRFAIVDSDLLQFATNAPGVDFIVISEPKTVKPSLLKATFPTAAYVFKSNIPPWRLKKWEPLQASIHALKKDGAFTLEK